MRLGIMQPYLFPYLGYFQLMHAVEKFVLLDEVNYIKKGWINRNNIEVAGVPFLFTLPLLNLSQNTLIRDCRIDMTSKWRGRFLKTLALSYAKAPCFNTVYPLLEKILLYEESNLAPFIYNSLTCLCDFLQIKTVIIPGTAAYSNIHLRGQERILDICKQEGASVYINPSGGVDLYHKPAFEQVGIQLQFIHPGIVDSGQEAKPPFSIIHVMMHYSREAIISQLDHFTLH